MLRALFLLRINVELRAWHAKTNLNKHNKLGELSGGIKMPVRIKPSAKKRQESTKALMARFNKYNRRMDKIINGIRAKNAKLADQIQTTLENARKGIPPTHVPTPPQSRPRNRIRNHRRAPASPSASGTELAGKRNRGLHPQISRPAQS
jgi:hypothetical protein